jgi:hypothetical protein
MPKSPVGIELKIERFGDHLVLMSGGNAPKI